MRRLYYFSKSQLKYIEVKQLNFKFLSLSFVALIILTTFIVGVYSVSSYFISSGNEYSSLKKENELLKSKLDGALYMYQDLNQKLKEVSDLNDQLRMIADIQPITPEEKLLSVGGGYFDNLLDFSNGNNDQTLQNTLNYINEVAKKVEFEKNLYSNIQSKINENRQKFNSIPALKPCSGTYTTNGFGMRLHPILHVNKMHDGIDILTDIGTLVHAPANGKVDFVGTKGGYGLAVEIDHGYGYRTLYAHLSEVKVQIGDVVTRGDIIAATGTSGLSSGPHLHYEVQLNGIKQDPVAFFFDEFNYY